MCKCISSLMNVALTWWNCNKMMTWSVKLCLWAIWSLLTQLIKVLSSARKTSSSNVLSPSHVTSLSKNWVQILQTMLSVSPINRSVNLKIKPLSIAVFSSGMIKISKSTLFWETHQKIREKIICWNQCPQSLKQPTKDINFLCSNNQISTSRMKMMD